MKQADLLQTMKDLGISLPEYGTGRGQKITNNDLEDAIGDYYFQDLPEKEKRHMDNRLQIRPQKSFLFNKLRSDFQKSIMEDNNDWVAEEKLNGWRVIISYLPKAYRRDGEARLRYYGGNLSTVTMLPVDYTDHVLLSMPIHIPDDIDVPILIDCECTCNQPVMTQDGRMTTDPREAVATILGSLPAEAMQHQAEGAELIFNGFHIIEPNSMSLTYGQQQILLARIAVANIDNPHYVHVLPQHTDKTKLVNSIWRNGGEGIVLKKVTQPYVSNSRLKTHSIKLKRTMSGIIGDYIDAYVSSYVLTEEHSKNGLIGGLVMSVYIDDVPHVIATVSNMPDHIREELTFTGPEPKLNPMAYGKVLELDGMELSSRNRRLMHAVVKDWVFRKDKNATDCTFSFDDDAGGMF